MIGDAPAFLAIRLENTYVIHEHKKSEPSAYRLKVRISLDWWSIGDSNS